MRCRGLSWMSTVVDTDGTVAVGAEVEAGALGVNGRACARADAGGGGGVVAGAVEAVSGVMVVGVASGMAGRARGRGTTSETVHRVASEMPGWRGKRPRQRHTCIVFARN